MKDRRKPWQKKASVRWARCGTQLAENADYSNKPPTVKTMREAVICAIDFSLSCPVERDAALRLAKSRKATIDDLVRLSYVIAWCRAWGRPLAESLDIMSETTEAVAQLKFGTTD